jgi:hypothetical protein
MEAWCNYIDKGPVDKIPLKLEIEAMHLAVRKIDRCRSKEFDTLISVVDPPNGDDFVKEVNLCIPGSIS